MSAFHKRNVHFFRQVAAIFLFLIAPFLFSCGRGEEPVKVDFSKREEIGFVENPNTVTYAYVPQYSHRVSFERHHPLVEYLKKETSFPIRQVFPDSFDDYIRMIGQGKIDISFSNPFIYVKVAQRYGVSAIARILELDGKENFRGLIICRSDNRQIQDIQDCKGKRWAAVDPSSAAGFLYALGHFWDHGIHREDFGEVAFVPGAPGGQQERVVLAVYSGRYDIGSVREGALELLAGKIDLSQIRILAHTPWYPGWMYATRKGLPTHITAAVKDALLKLDCTNPAHRPICESAHFAGIIPADDSDFDSIRRLAEKVGTDIDE